MIDFTATLYLMLEFACALRSPTITIAAARVQNGSALVVVAEACENADAGSDEDAECARDGEKDAADAGMCSDAREAAAAVAGGGTHGSSVLIARSADSSSGSGASHP